MYSCLRRVFISTMVGSLPKPQFQRQLATSFQPRWLVVTAFRRRNVNYERKTFLSINTNFEGIRSWDFYMDVRNAAHHRPGRPRNPARCVSSIDCNLQLRKPESLRLDYPWCYLAPGTQCARRFCLVVLRMTFVNSAKLLRACAIRPMLVLQHCAQSLNHVDPSLMMFLQSSL
jgi:hypothetical protein